MDDCRPNDGEKEKKPFFHDILFTMIVDEEDHDAEDSFTIAHLHTQQGRRDPPFYCRTFIEAGLEMISQNEMFGMKKPPLPPQEEPPCGFSANCTPVSSCSFSLSI